ncbi:amino acid adenylation domain-containing protein [Paenibacillus sp.]
MKDILVPTQGLGQALTHPQKRIRAVEALFPHSPLHNIGGVVRMEGALHRELMEQAIRIFIHAHEGIRVQVILHDNEPRQFISDVPGLDESILTYQDFTGQSNPEAIFEQWVRDQARIPFEMGHGPLYAFALCAIGDNYNGLLIKLHHIIADGWSVALLTEQLWAIYDRLQATHSQNGTNEIGNAPLFECSAKMIQGSRLQDAVMQEDQYIASRRFDQDRLFWMRKFEDLPDTPLRSGSDLSGKRRSFLLDRSLSDAVKQFVNHTNSSLNLLFVALYYVYLHRMEGKSQITIGMPIMNRSGAVQKNTFGMFTGTMPFRLKLHEEWSFEELLGHIQHEMKLCYKHHRYPYDRLLQDLHAAGWEQTSLFDTSINYYNTRHVTEMNGLKVSNTEFYNGEQWYALQWVIRDWSSDHELSLDLDYQTAVYSEEEIERMYVVVCRILEQVMAHPELRISQLHLTTPQEEQWQRYEYNATTHDYPKEQTIIQRLEQQVRRSPHHVAVMHEVEKLTYAELDTRANQLAHFLVAKGAGRGQVVGLHMDHSVETVIAILAVLKSGSAYLPLDGSQPRERLAFMTRDSGVQWIVSNRSDRFDYAGEWITFSSHRQLHDINLMEEKVVPDMCIEPCPEDLAYIIYTSGSTGQPKGTLIKHQALLNYIEWAAKMYTRGEGEVFALYSSLAFDLTVTSIFTPLLSGGSIAVYPEDGEEHAIYRIVKDNITSVLKLTPSHLSLLKGMDHQNSSIRRLIVGGEDLKSALARSIDQAWGGHVEIFNEYGPTEATVGCMTYMFDRTKDVRGSLPIGVPADNVQIYVLDDKLRLLPAGATGEIYIAGDGLAEGYLNRPESTDAHFLAHPFEPGKRIYKTGDLGRFGPNGQLEYKNRADFQLSVRGYRIEPGEVESALLVHPSVSEAAVTAVNINGRSPQLCAYLVMNTEEESESLRAFLAQRLPSYMIPLHYMYLDRMPVTSNGKLNRSLLPEPLAVQTISTDQGEDVFTQDPTVATLHDVLKEVLELEEIVRDNNFYQLGGDSIKAIQTTSLLRERGYVLAANDMLANPLLADMVHLIRPQKQPDRKPSRTTGSLPDTPMHVWFRQRVLDQPQHYHQRVLLDIRTSLSISDISCLLDRLVQHHDTFRINQDRDGEQFYYNDSVHLAAYTVHELANESDIPVDLYDSMLEVADAAERSLDLTADQLLQAFIFCRNGDPAYLLLTAHHTIIDGVSWRIVLDDLDRAAQQLMEGRELCLPAPTSSYLDWGSSLHHQLDAIHEREQRYWENVSQQIRPIFVTPGSMKDEQAVSEPDRGEEHFRIELPEDITRQLLTSANESYNTRPVELMLTGLFAAIRSVTGQQNISLDLEGHGREQLDPQLDLSRTIGWFTSLYPFTIQSLQTEWDGLIKQVKEQHRLVPGGGSGYGILRYLKQSLPGRPHNDLIFNYLGEFAMTRGSEAFGMVPDRRAITSSRRSSLYPLEINGGVFGRKLVFEARCNMDTSDLIPVQSIMDRFRSCLLEVIAHCSAQSSPIFTPSDFDSVGLTQDELDSIFS